MAIISELDKAAKLKYGGAKISFVAYRYKMLKAEYPENESAHLREKQPYPVQASLF